ncbi:MAG: glycosyltransferase family 9 protein, partial [Nitrospinota bacterium]
MGKTGEAGVPRIRPTPENLRRAGALLNGLGIGADRPYFILHPGSGGRWKRWPISLFARLGERLAGEGEVVGVAGPAEEGVLEEVRAQSRGRDVKA